MTGKLLNQYGRQARTFLLLLSIALISFLAYRDILAYFFTGMDAIPLIDSSRIQSPGDIVRIFAEPGLREFPEAYGLHKWYRPVAVLSYSIDYSIWEMNPFGYHLTDLLLHILVAVSIFILSRLLMKGREITAWLGALIFSIHPLIVDVVPAVVRRMDIMATLFVLISLILFLKYYYSSFMKKWHLFISLIFFAAAIGTKEIAVVVPVLVFIYAFLFLSKQGLPLKGRVVQAFNVSSLYLLVTFLYIAVRIIVLEGIGGYTESHGGMLSFITFLLTVSTDYFIYLIYPVDLLQAGRSVSGWPPLLLTALRGGLICVVIFTAVLKRKTIACYFSESEIGRVTAFLLAWILLPLAVYVVTRVSGRYYLYISVVPFSILLSITLAKSFEAILQKRGKGGSSVLIFSLAVLLAASLLLHSPLIRTYGEWRESGEIFNSLLNGISEAISSLPDDAAIHIYGLPVGIASYRDVTPHAEEVEYPDGYSIRSWLELNFPQKRVRDVVVKSRKMIPACPAEQSLKVTRDNDKTVVLTVEFDYDK